MQRDEYESIDGGNNRKWLLIIRRLIKILHVIIATLHFTLAIIEVKEEKDTKKWVMLGFHSFLMIKELINYCCFNSFQKSENGKKYKIIFPIILVFIGIGFSIYRIVENGINAVGIISIVLIALYLILLALYYCKKCCS